MAQKLKQTSKVKKKGRTAADASLPLEVSVGYQIRITHRALQRYLQTKIEPFGVTLGMWYFLRALWEEDGLTQRELSRRIGTKEPTTLIAIQGMERGGLVKRVRSRDDQRKLHVYLTPKGRKLKAELLPLAREVVSAATTNFNQSDIKQLLRYLAAIQWNLREDLEKLVDDEALV